VSDSETDRCWASVVERTCAVCLDRTDSGVCLIPGHPGDCKLKENFAAVVDIVRRVRSGSMEPYLAAVEEEICARCADMTPSGCRRRDHGQCALYALLPITLDAVEDALSEREKEREA
jgi:hypothetical protein